MRMSRLMIAAIALSCLIGLACSDSDSDAIETRALRAIFVARGDVSGATDVTAKLRLGFDPVELTGGDLLIATRTDPVTIAEDERFPEASTGRLERTHSC